jgi:hypothetical protein
VVNVDDILRDLDVTEEDRTRAVLEKANEVDLETRPRKAAAAEAALVAEVSLIRTRQRWRTKVLDILEISKQ